MYKGSVDLTDQITDEYSIMRTTNRWTLALFFNLVDVCIHNAFLLFIAANPTWKTNDRSRKRLFLQWLAKDLAYNQVRRRQLLPGLQNNVKSKIEMFLENYAAIYGSAVSCGMCSENESLQLCRLCKKDFCSKHIVCCSLFVCPNCTDKKELTVLRRQKDRKRCRFCRVSSDIKTTAQCHNCNAYVCSKHEKRKSVAYNFCRECKQLYNYWFKSELKQRSILFHEHKDSENLLHKCNFFCIYIYESETSKHLENTKKKIKMLKFDMLHEQTTLTKNIQRNRNAGNPYIGPKYFSTDWNVSMI